MSDTSSDSNRGHRFLERGLLGTALLLLGWCVIVHVETEFVQRSENRRLEALLAEAPRGVPESQRAAIAPRPVDGELLGRIEIGRLGLTAVVQEGVEPHTLRRAVGHIPDTALFGSEGNVGLAGHRDTFFRKLRDVRVGDEIVLTGLDGRNRYLVRETRVVEPGETWVLEPTERASVTLVTCYPFQFIGAAPQRFVVRADRLDEPLLMAGSGPAIIPVSVEGAALATMNSRIVSKRAAVKSLEAGSRRATGARTKAKATSRDAKKEARDKAKAPRQKRGFWKRLFSVIT